MIVTELEIIAAMQYWEDEHIRKNGPLDRITLPKECAKLADLLGTMWYVKTDTAQIQDGGESHTLMSQALNRDVGINA